jgi:hypothetical protein
LLHEGGTSTWNSENTTAATTRAILARSTTASVTKKESGIPAKSGRMNKIRAGGALLARTRALRPFIRLLASERIETIAEPARNSLFRGSVQLDREAELESTLTKNHGRPRRAERHDASQQVGAGRSPLVEGTRHTILHCRG